MRASFYFGLGALALAAVIVACVGEDPVAAVPAPVSPEGSTSPPLPDSGGPAVEAGPTTCAGQPFSDLQPITIDDGDAGAGKVSGVRLVGSVAYLAKARPDKEPRPYRGTFTASPPRIVLDAPLMADTHPNEADTWPAVADDGSFLVFTHGAAPGRRIWSSRADPLKGPPPFFNGSSVDQILGAFNGDEAEPWLAGTPTRALYWARADSIGAKFRIVRSKVQPVPGDEPRFEAPSLFTMTCPSADDHQCTLPVVSPDERIMLFAHVGVVGTPTLVPYETALATTNDVVAATGAPIPHAELGARYPSWISADGCEAIFGGADDHVYAKRTPK